MPHHPAAGRVFHGHPAVGRGGLYRCATEPRRPLVPRSRRVSSLRVTIPWPSGCCAACALRLLGPWAAPTLSPGAARLVVGSPAASRPALPPGMPARSSGPRRCAPTPATGACPSAAARPARFACQTVGRCPTPRPRRKAAPAGVLRSLRSLVPRRGGAGRLGTVRPVKGPSPRRCAAAGRTNPLTGLPARGGRVKKGIRNIWLISGYHGEVTTPHFIGFLG